MNSIPSYISDAIVGTVNNILTNKVEVDQTTTDTYVDDHRYLVKREFKVCAVSRGGDIYADFMLMETYPDRKALRVNLNGVDSAEIIQPSTDSILRITAGAYSVEFIVTPAEE